MEEIKRIVSEALREYFEEHPIVVNQSRGNLDAEQVAEYLGVSRQWVYQNVDKIPHYKFGNLVRFKKDEIDDWQNNLKYQNVEYEGVKIRSVE